MKIVITEGHQLAEKGNRLDASYHASEGVQALNFIRRWTKQRPVQSNQLRELAVPYGSQPRTEPLAKVCQPNGVFIPSRFKRIFVDDPNHGAPYLTGGSILQADPLNGAKLLSYKFTENMEQLALQKRMILVTCSGTIGNSVYVNANFKGAVGSPDLLRIIADPDRIPPGYLYTYLSSKLGKALIEQQTYGAVVPHIEAHHVVNLPIPRLDPATEQRIHNLIEQAASLRVVANELIKDARLELLLQNSLRDLTPEDYYFYGATRAGRSPGSFIVSSKRISSLTINAWNYADKFDGLKKTIVANSNSCPFADVLLEDGYTTGSWFKRVPTSEGRGVELLTQKQLFNLRKEGNWVSTVPIPDLESETVKNGTILIAGVGTMGESEVFGRCEFVWNNLENKLVVAEIIRVQANPEKVDPAYLFAYLSSDYGFRLLRSTITGTKLCRFIQPLIMNMPVPVVDMRNQQKIGDKIRQAYDNRAEALELEDEAQALLASTLGLKSDSFAPVRPEAVEVEV